MTYIISAKKILVVFPNSYTLQDAHYILSKWNPDTINWGIVNGNPTIYVTCSNRIQRKVKKLSDRGINFYSGANITKIPPLNNPPLDDPPYCNAIEHTQN